MKRLTRRSIQAGLSATAVALTLASPAWAVFTVDTTSDANLTACTAAAGDCSLRGAISNVNAGAGGDTIDFEIALAGLQTITLTSDLPTITQAVTINGYTEDGSVQSNTQTGPITAAPAVV